MRQKVKPRYGELKELKKAFKNKRYKVTVLNNIDKRMHTKFLRSMWNWYPNTCDRKWVRKFYITDNQLHRRVGKTILNKLSYQEFLEVKALCMVRNSLWYSFHKFNRQFNNRWKIKYDKEATEFDIEVEDTSHYNHKAKDNVSKYRESKNNNISDDSKAT